MDFVSIVLGDVFSQGGLKAGKHVLHVSNEVQLCPKPTRLAVVCSIGQVHDLGTTPAFGRHVEAYWL